MYSFKGTDENEFCFEKTCIYLLFLIVSLITLYSIRILCLKSSSYNFWTGLDLKVWILFFFKYSYNTTLKNVQVGSNLLIYLYLQDDHSHHAMQCKVKYPRMVWTLLRIPLCSSGRPIADDQHECDYAIRVMLVVLYKCWIRVIFHVRLHCVLQSFGSGITVPSSSNLRKILPTYECVIIIIKIFISVVSWASWIILEICWQLNVRNVIVLNLHKHMAQQASFYVTWVRCKYCK